MHIILNNTNYLLLMQPSQKLSKLSTITLSTGHKISRIGFGTYLLRGESGIKSILCAIQNGYTQIDSATMYGNEKQIKKAIQLSGVERSQLYITTKVGPNQQGYKEARKAVEGVLKSMGCGYLNLALIHWPASYSFNKADQRNQQIRLQTWRSLIQLQKQGKIIDIGVSNFLVHHLQHLLEHFPNNPPVINQIELHPLLSQPETIKFCRQHNIAIQAYSPLAHNHQKLFTNKTLKQLAAKHNKSIAQIALRWGLQNDYIILPKSANQQRIKQNINIFDFQLSADQMNEINQLNKMNVRTDWDPHGIEL